MHIIWQDKKITQIISGLVENEHFFRKVVPPGQGFDGDYCGLFRFRFYRHGDWFEVKKIVSQRFPYHFPTYRYIKTLK